MDTKSKSKFTPIFFCCKPRILRAKLRRLITVAMWGPTRWKTLPKSFNNATLVQTTTFVKLNFTPILTNPKRLIQYINIQNVVIKTLLENPSYIVKFT